MSDEQWVCVVRDANGAVLAVLGPRPTVLEANATGQVVRRSQGELVSLHRVREPNIRDLHGEGFDE